ncbi:phytoene/squalene synthase family protein [Crocinitomicaceae bacterium CZZ-1]|uniref:Phytoene/squalene synthase family protein n=1 Tax=Taishania pollutisoli TaxID=2766479 RepID=A0A8J6PJN2_9FLAO|nr:phytoene/squalene synthase family protein [Taishania pollutisoli]MBC9812360.1 phytoene/squalene synthase family protein [Taishania pollutisoli]
MKIVYDNISSITSKTIAQTYSTSFSMGIRLLNKKLQEPIYNIYGFVRIADEIVDSFHDCPQADLLQEFRQDTYNAIDRKISTNPVLQSFQKTVNEFGIERELIDTFLDSMEMDLEKIDYNSDLYEKYILGSAEVVGLMCLRVFVYKNDAMYEELKPYAMKLGSAFQKINFLRDLKDDYQDLGRIYFPNVDMSRFDETTKKELITEIEQDFKIGLDGIKKLPKSSRFGVYLAYVYYTKLLGSIKQRPAHTLLNERVRIPDRKKYTLLVSSYVRHQFNFI